MRHGWCTTIQIDISPAPPRLRVSPSNAHSLGLPCRARRPLQRSVDRNSFRSLRGARMCRCAGVPARMTAVGARCAGVPARVTETRDLGGQLFCRPSASLPRRCDSVDRRCIAQNGAAALRPLAVPARDARPTGGKGRGCCAQDIPAGVFGKPLRAIFRFRRQDIQTPPSPLVGKGGRGDEGQKRTGMQKITHLSQGIYP